VENGVWVLANRKILKKNERRERCKGQKKKGKSLRIKEETNKGDPSGPRI